MRIFIYNVGGENQVNVLKFVRKQRGYTVEQASILSGIPKSLLSQIENGQRTCPVEKAQILARLYKVPIENIFTPIRFSPRIEEVKNH